MELRLQCIIFFLVNLITFGSIIHFTWLFFNPRDDTEWYGKSIPPYRHRYIKVYPYPIKDYLSKENNPAANEEGVENENLARESHPSDTNQQAEINLHDGNENVWKPATWPNVSEITALQPVTFINENEIPQAKQKSYMRAPRYVYGKVRRIYPDEYIQYQASRYVPQDMFEAALMNDIKVLAKALNKVMVQKEMERRNSYLSEKETVIQEVVSTFYSRRTRKRMYYYAMRAAKGRHPRMAYGVLMKLQTIEQKYEVYNNENEIEVEIENEDEAEIEVEMDYDD